MEHIAPIGTDAMGVTSFEKLETIPVELPDLAAQARAPKSCSKCSDSVNFSRPMKKHLIKKRSYFKRPPSQQEQRLRQERTQPAPLTELQRNPQPPLLQ